MKKLSIIIPIYNEKNTVEELLGKVCDLQLNGFEKEIIIVEDNSKDGTREIVKDFCQDHPDCKLILNNIPGGKGHAVRMGFKNATGDIFAIQDADLEYDVNDYHRLMKPFQENDVQFVLGSRHINEKGKMIRMIRKFHGKEKILAYFMNLGGIIYHNFFNLLYGTRLTDPTTMYKVFTRELYEKVNLTGVFFELDWEIVSKFVRLGYIPAEVPVKYQSRGFGSGKKIRIFRDGSKGLFMMIKCRFMPKTKILRTP